MNQAPLFGQDDLASKLIAVGVGGSRPALSKAQKRFNDLTGRIGAQRQLLQQWRDFVPAYHQRVQTEVTPLIARLRERRTAMVRLLDEALEGKSLAKTHRAKAVDVLLGLASELLNEAAPEAELVRLYDKYSDQSFEDEQQEGMNMVKAIAGNMFGVDLDDEEVPASPEALAERIATKMQAAEAMRAQQQAKPRKPNAKAQARAAAKEQAAEGASRSLREVYRKLVSELHPDRETDAALHAQKTEAMQKVNQAYEARDLLALLEVQLSMAQIDPTALADMAQERLAHYTLVLEEQLLRLQEELADLTAPFLVALGRPPRNLTPTFVARALDDDMAHMRASVREIEADLDAFRDPKQLKAFLRQHRVNDFDDDGIEEFKSMLLAQATQGRR